MGQVHNYGKAKEDLLPIGFELEIRYPPDPTTTDYVRGTTDLIITYRVVEHRQIARFRGDTADSWGECIEAIAARSVVAEPAEKVADADVP